MRPSLLRPGMKVLVRSSLSERVYEMVFVGRSLPGYRPQPEYYFWCEALLDTDSEAPVYKHEGRPFNIELRSHEVSKHVARAEK